MCKWMRLFFVFGVNKLSVVFILICFLIFSQLMIAKVIKCIFYVFYLII